MRYDIAPPVDLAGSHHRSIAAAFGELRIPLVDEGASIPRRGQSCVSLSGRMDDYSDVGRSFNPEYALIWRPSSALTLRTSLAQSFRPPPLSDLYIPIVDALVPIVDPARNDEFAVPVWRAGGNSDLKPSRADSLSVGLEIRADRGTGRCVSAQTIGESPSTIRSPSRLQRGCWPLKTSSRTESCAAPPSAADIAAGMPGAVQLIDITRVNFGSVRTSGVDASASVILDTPVGRFKPELSATWVHDFTTSDLVDGLAVRRVGVANPQGTLARWRVVATVGWNHRGCGRVRRGAACSLV